VISVGVATVAAAVGAGGLGTYIFRGVRQNDNNLLLAGALASALLALLCDFALGQFEKSYEIAARSAGKRRIVALALVAVLALLVGAGPIANFKSNISDSKPITIGSKDFTESIILAEILAQMLERDGIAVTRQFELGGNLAHDGLLAGEVDAYPEYTGTAYTAILKHPPITDPQAVYDQTRQEYAEKFKLVVSPPLGFSNDFAILIRGEVARKNNLKTISDAVPIARDWKIGFGQDFMSRSDGYQGFRRFYGFEFSRIPREMDLSLTYRALASGELDMIAGNSTDGLISALDLVQLEDDWLYFPPYQAVFIARNDVETILKPTLGKLSQAISTDEMRRLNYEVDGNKRSPRQVAAEWLLKK
jgi:osmoprotectant transport system permease protein